MANFLAVGLEKLPNGDAYIGVGVEDPQVAGESLAAEWRTCTAKHAHDWGVCDVKALFADAKTKLEAAATAGKPAATEFVAPPADHKVTL